MNNGNNITTLSTFKDSKTVFEFIQKMMNHQLNGIIILKKRGASNTRELGNLFHKLQKRKTMNNNSNQQPKTMTITHNSYNTSHDPLNWEGSQLELSFPFTILKKESHPNGKPSLYIYTIQHNQQTI